MGSATKFATQAPQNINTCLIYDTVKGIYRPIQDSDFSNNLDAFGRLRVSNPEMIFNCKQLYDNQPLYWDDIEETGTGTSSVYSQNRASTTLSVSASTAGKRTRQSFARINYQPGKSQLILMTGIIKKTGGGSGITARMGIFDDQNGLFFQNKNGTLSFVKRSYVTGVAVDSVFTQANWNIDTMDGDGPSKINLNPTKAQILVIDFEWLGVGRVRYGFNIDGITYYCHEILNANINDSVYMSTPNLPLRYQIENDGTGVASSLEATCTAVLSEGGKEDVGTNTYLSTDGTAITATKAQNNALLGIRLKTGSKSCTIDVLDADILVTSNDNFEWTLTRNPSVAGTFTYNDIANSQLQYAVGNGSTNVTSGGYKVAGGYGTQKAQIQGDQLKNLLKLGCSITGAMDTLILSVSPLGASNITVYAGLNVREFN